VLWKPNPGISAFLKNNIKPEPAWQEIVDFSYRAPPALSYEPQLGMSVLIQGFETAKQLRMIKTLGTIAEAHGPPIPEKDVSGLLRRDFGVQAP
jgi:hypothetical protein